MKSLMLVFMTTDVCVCFQARILRRKRHIHTCTPTPHRRVEAAFTSRRCLVLECERYHCRTAVTSPAPRSLQHS